MGKPINCRSAYLKTLLKLRKGEKPLRRVSAALRDHLLSPETRGYGAGQREVVIIGMQESATGQVK